MKNKEKRLAGDKYPFWVVIPVGGAILVLSRHEYLDTAVESCKANKASKLCYVVKVEVVAR